MAPTGGQTNGGPGATFLEGLRERSAAYAERYDGQSPVLRLTTVRGDVFLVYGSQPGPLPSMVGLTVFDEIWVEVRDEHGPIVRTESQLVLVTLEDELQVPGRVVFLRVEDVALVEFLHEAPPLKRRNRWPKGLSAHVGVPGFGFQYRDSE